MLFFIDNLMYTFVMLLGTSARMNYSEARGPVARAPASRLFTCNILLNTRVR